MASTLIRAYERTDLPIAERLSSLARRFPSLKGASGLDPFDADELYRWALENGPGSAGFHAATLLLNLSGPGPWEQFDALAAARVWDDADKTMFVNWLLAWRF